MPLGEGVVHDFTPWGCLTNAPLEERQFSIVVQTVEYVDAGLHQRSADGLRRYAIHLDIIRHADLPYDKATFRIEVISDKNVEVLNLPLDIESQGIQDSYSDFFHQRYMWITETLGSKAYDVHKESVEISNTRASLSFTLSADSTLAGRMPLTVPLLLQISAGDEFRMSIEGTIRTSRRRSEMPLEFEFEILDAPCLHFGWKKPPLPPSQRVSVFEMREVRANKCTLM